MTGTGRMQVLSSSQIGTIHALAAKVFDDDDAYRDFLQGFAQVRSSKQLTREGAARVIDRLKQLAGQTPAKGAVAGLDGALATKLRALWIAGWNLGLIDDRADQAMLAFLQRQTGVSHPRFFREPGQATAAIEALKSWLARDAGVDWPSPSAPGTGKTDAVHHGVKAGADAAKHAVIKAQWRKLLALGKVRAFEAANPLGNLPEYAYRIVGKNGWCFFTAADYDKVSRQLGRMLRAARDRNSAQAPPRSLAS